MTSYPQFERTYNAVDRISARRLTAKLRRCGYQVRRRQQWVYVLAETLDATVSAIARYYGAIAY
jgi:hypothetical protein